MNTPTISVIIPAHNGAGLLNQSLDSIARQTVLPDEVIDQMSSGTQRGST